MSLHSPKTITLVESNPSSVDHYRIQLLAEGTGEVVSDATYASDSGGTTVIPMGSNGSMNNLGVGQNFQIKVYQQKNGVNGDPQIVSGGPFTNVLLPDGAESISVQL